MPGPKLVIRAAWVGALLLCGFSCAPEAQLPESHPIGLPEIGLTLLVGPEASVEEGEDLSVSYRDPNYVFSARYHATDESLAQAVAAHQPETDGVIVSSSWIDLCGQRAAVVSRATHGRPYERVLIAVMADHKLEIRISRDGKFVPWSVVEEIASAVACS